MRRFLVAFLGLVLAAGALGATATADDRNAFALARQAAGQRVVYSYPGLTPPESLLARIRAGEAAGVIFFGENVASLTQIRGGGAAAAGRGGNEPQPEPAPAPDRPGGRAGPPPAG